MKNVLSARVGRVAKLPRHSSPTSLPPPPRTTATKKIKAHTYPTLNIFFGLPREMPGRWIKVHGKEERLWDRKHPHHRIQPDLAPHIRPHSNEGDAIVPEEHRKELPKAREDKNSAAERPRGPRDPHAWPPSAAVLSARIDDVLHAIEKSLSGFGAETSLFKAQHAATVLDRVLANSAISSGNEIDDPVVCPLAAIQRDPSASAALDRVAQTYLRFGPDGDAGTMLRLVESFVGTKGGREDRTAEGLGIGGRLVMQCLLEYNLRHALAMLGDLRAVFLSESGLFNSPRAYKNLVFLARNIQRSISRSLVAPHGPSPLFEDHPPTSVDIKNALIAVLSILSSDRCLRHDPIDAVTILRECRTILHLLENNVRREPSNPRKPTHTCSLLTPQDIEIFFSPPIVHALVTSNEDRLIVDLVSQLGVGYHPDSARFFFQPLLRRIAPDIPAIGRYIEILLLALKERPDLYASWAESFAKTPAVSLLVLQNISTQHVVVDESFLDKVVARVEKAIAQGGTDRPALQESLALLTGTHIAHAYGVVDAAKARFKGRRLELHPRSFLSVHGDRRATVGRPPQWLRPAVAMIVALAIILAAVYWRR